MSDPGRFEIIVPIAIDYDAIERKAQDILASQSETHLSGTDIEVYPSSGSLVIGARIGKSGEWIYLTATPQVDAGTGTLRFPDLAMSADATAAAQEALDPALLQALRDQLSVDFKAGYDEIVASANARLTRPLGDGFRSEGKLTSAGIANVLLLSDRVQVNLRADGRLKLIYGG